VTDAELDDLVRRFNACAVPRTEWTHQAHLAVGLWHVSQYKRKDALQRLRAGITRLNESNGVVNSATGGYHETVTRAYVALLSDFAARNADKTAAERVRALLEDPLSDKKALLRFYSRALLESSEARLDWVEPDLALLP
jgi:hypothetical protein